MGTFWTVLICLMVVGFVGVTIIDILERLGGPPRVDPTPPEHPVRKGFKA